MCKLLPLVEGFCVEQINCLFFPLLLHHNHHRESFCDLKRQRFLSSSKQTINSSIMDISWVASNPVQFWHCLPGVIVRAQVPITILQVVLPLLPADQLPLNESSLIPSSDLINFHQQFTELRETRMFISLLGRSLPRIQRCMEQGVGEGVQSFRALSGIPPCRNFLVSADHSSLSPGLWVFIDTSLHRCDWSMSKHVEMWLGKRTWPDANRLGGEGQWGLSA
jgi:hypothetical protein